MSEIRDRGNALGFDQLEEYARQLYEKMSAFGKRYINPSAVKLKDVLFIIRRYWTGPQNDINDLAYFFLYKITHYPMEYQELWDG